VAVLLGTARQADPPVDHHEVVVGRGHEHLARAQLVAVRGVPYLELTVAIEDPRECAGAGRGNMDDHEHGCRQVSREPGHEVAQRLDAAR
jgi:hypothetical protein